MTPATANKDAPAPAKARRRDALWLFALALAANGAAAVFVSQPGYTDAYYYFGGARQLAGGNGFTEPYLWNYLSPARAVDPAHPLWPSHLYWMPLVSMVAAPFIALAQAVAGRAASTATLFRAAQLPFILLAACLPLLGYAVAGWMGGSRRQAVAAALLTLFSPFYFVYWTTTDVFVVYALTAATAIGLTALAASRTSHGSAWLLGAGLAAGLAHLTRADGLLLLVCLLAWVCWRPPLGNSWRGRAWACAAILVGYAIIMAPWLARDWVVTGSPLAPGGTRTIWLTSYDDIFTFTPARLSLANYLASGPRVILSGKWGAFGANFLTLFSVQGEIIAFPFMLVGLWRLRHNALVQLALLYAAVLFAAMTLIFTFPGERGSYFHSGVALVPFFMAAAVAGLDASVDAVARVLRHWRPEQSKPVFTALLAGGAMLLTLVVFWQRAIGPDALNPTWGQTERAFGAAGVWMQAQGQAGDLVMVNDPPGWNYWTGWPAIVTPNNDVATMRQAMVAYGARWLLVQLNLPAPLAALYRTPGSQAGLLLRTQFVDEDNHPVYLYELGPGS